MAEIKEKTVEVFNEAKDHAKRCAAAPTCRTILIAACVGVLIGLLLKR